MTAKLSAPTFRPASSHNALRSAGSAKSTGMACGRRREAPAAAMQGTNSRPPLTQVQRRRGRRPKPPFAVSRLRAKPPSPRPVFRHNARYRENAVLRGGLAPTPACGIQGSSHRASWPGDAPEFISVPECSTPLLEAARPALMKTWHPKDRQWRGTDRRQDGNKRPTGKAEVPVLLQTRDMVIAAARSGTARRPPRTAPTAGATRRTRTRKGAPSVLCTRTDRSDQ